MIVYPGKDPMAPLAFMVSATRLPFELKLMEGGWQATRYQLIRAFDETLTGMFDVMLGDESKLLDDRAEYVLYVEPEEEEKARAILAYLMEDKSA